MVINLRKYFASDDTAESIQYDFNINDTGDDGKKLFPGLIHVEGHVKSFSGSALVDLNIIAIMETPCDRCGKEFSMDVSMSLSHVIVPKTRGDEDDERYIVVEDEQVDLDDLVTEDIYLNLSSKILCREDCKGLCPICGINLNEETCNCQIKLVDPRLEGLRQLLDNKD